MYELVTDIGEGIEEPAPVNFGDMRELLGGEYAANVVRRTDGSAVLGIGSHRYVLKKALLTPCQVWMADVSQPGKF
jgi:hypothetical protein